MEKANRRRELALRGGGRIASASDPGASTLTTQIKRRQLPVGAGGATTATVAGAAVLAAGAGLARATMTPVRMTAVRRWKEILVFM